MKRSLILITFITLIAGVASAQSKIPAKEAAKHIGETVMVCDKVYGTKFFDNSGMTLLDLGGNHPNQYLTVVINKEDRGKFKDKPEDYFKGTNVCVTGKIIDYHGKPEIIVNDPKDLKIDMTDNAVKQKRKIEK
jgi:micrococcal nuclease